MFSQFGAFFAVLPAYPINISSDDIRETCNKVCYSKKTLDRLVYHVQNGDDATTITECVCVSFEWLMDRVVLLNHPQLSTPLEYLELSAKLVIQVLDDEEKQVFNTKCYGDLTAVANAECERLAQILIDEHAYVVGNAELLLVLQETPIPLLDAKLPITSISCLENGHEKFKKFGLVVLEEDHGAVISEEILISLKEATAEQFNNLYKAMLMKQQLAHVQGKKQRSHFKEIMQRDLYRFDFKLQNNEIMQDLGQRGPWLPLVQQILGGANNTVLVKVGCVLSLPGTGTQYWHSDGVHLGVSASFQIPTSSAAPCHALCVFLPLIDLTEQTGYTEFWAGSQVFAKLLQKQGELSLPGGTRGIITRGKVMLYDFRVIHRGMPNTSMESRPICYFLYAREGFENVEEQNFETESVFDQD